MRSVFSVVKESKKKFNHREHGEHRDRGEVSLRAPAGILTLRIASVYSASSVVRDKKKITTESTESTEMKVEKWPLAFLLRITSGYSVSSVVADKKKP